jgi:hypothetical protein
MKDLPPRLLGRIEAAFWGPRSADLPLWKLRALRLGRTVLVLAQDFVRGQLTLRAMSLVYTTLLSMVPLLALSFSVLKAFGVSTQVQSLLLTFLAPLGEAGAELARRVAGFIDRMNVGVLGALGLALLLYTAVSLVQKVEEALNFIWHVSRPRPIGERFSRYLSVLLVGPILVFSALGITATVTSMDAVRDVLAIGPSARLPASSADLPLTRWSSRRSPSSICSSPMRGFVSVRLWSAGSPAASPGSQPAGFSPSSSRRRASTRRSTRASRSSSCS